ncbi:hypothetical protein Cgig2_022201 [Carnegiea gigantea]|uniref:Uncharacterized protein n=1 Tax=Carnegiea gigantea TaxID=171969 RepID=A0A9Q1GLZ0_9CARY|nr:hypothetical protein Cgig2_022199 [Carnegiea gigantea]KAJ8422460.1 hypothetical protein Cgig2_022201 [Carnegiea gigantea]
MGPLKEMPPIRWQKDRIWAFLLLNFTMNQNTQLTSQVKQEETISHAIKIMVWYVQGVGSSKILNVLKEHIRLQSLIIMALVETHISGARGKDVCAKLRLDGCFRVEAQGFQGGIWVLWKPNHLDINIFHSHEQYVTMEVKWRRHVEWLFIIVYANPRLQAQEILGTDLQQPGYFNEIISLDERNHRGPEMLCSRNKFKNWIKNNGLIDLDERAKLGNYEKSAP